MKEYKAIWLKEDKQLKVDLLFEHTQFTLKHSHESIPILYSDIELELGGFDEKQLFIKSRNGQHLLIEDPSFLEYFYTIAPGYLKKRIEELKSKQSKRNHRFVKILSIIVLLFSLFIGALFMSLPYIRQYLVDQIPAEWEVKFGESIYQNFEQENEIYQPLSSQAINTISTRLLNALDHKPYPFKFSIIASEEVNAFALPGGQMVIYSSLLQKAETPEEVAGVMAHEIQHVLHRHSLNRLVTNLEYMTVFSLFFGDMGGLLGLIEEMGMDILSSSYSRKQETQSDIEGLKLLIKAKIDPSGMVSFFEKLAQKEGKLPQIVHYISSHPSSQDRIVRLRKEIAKQPETTYQPLEIDWPSVQKVLTN